MHLDKTANIDQIMQKQYKRRLNHDQTVCLKNQIYLIKNSLQPGNVLAGTTIGEIYGSKQLR